VTVADATRKSLRPTQGPLCLDRWFYDKTLVVHLDHIADVELPAAARLGFAVYADKAILNQQLGLPAGTNQAAELQELIQTNPG
jgi:hypothetical protein